MRRTMRTIYLLIFLGILTFLSTVHAQQSNDEFYRTNLLHFLKTADLTAHVRLLGVKEKKEIRQRRMQTDGTWTDDGPIGIIRYTMKAEVLEVFVGPTVEYIEYMEFHETLSNPRTGEYIVSLNMSEDGTYRLADESGFVIPATANMLAVARDFHANYNR